MASIAHVYVVERPPDTEVERLNQKHGRIRWRTVRWDQRSVDYRREPADREIFGEVVLLIRDGGGRLALVRGAGTPTDRFDLPTGGIGEGEAVEDAAMREAREETGTEVRLEDLISVYRVRVRWKAWNLERWFFALRCLALSDSRSLRDQKEIEEVKFVRIPEEMPEWWSRNEWWGGRWRRQILEDGGLL